MGAFVALYEPGRRDELVDVLARRTALGADLEEEREGVMEVARGLRTLQLHHNL